MPQRLGNTHPNIVPYQAFATDNGCIILAVGNNSQFNKFCGAAGAPELAGDERFICNAKRVVHREELCAGIAALMSTKSSEKIQALRDVGAL